MLLHVVPREAWHVGRLTVQPVAHTARPKLVLIPRRGGGALTHVTRASCNCSPKVGGVNGLRVRADGRHAVWRVLVVAVVCLAVAMLCALPLRCMRRVGSSSM